MAIFCQKLLFETIVLATESQTKEMFVKDFIEIITFRQTRAGQTLETYKIK